MKSNKIKWLQITVSAGLIAILLYWSDIDQLKNAVKNADYKYLFYALLLILANRILMPVKWNFLLRAIKIRVSWYEVVKIYFISSFLGVFLPPTIGSDAVRAYYVHKKEYALTNIISSIVIERFIGLILLLLFGVIGCIILLNKFSDAGIDLPRLLIILASLCSVFFVLFFLSLSRRFLTTIGNILGKLSDKKLLGKVVGFIKKLMDSYMVYETRKDVLILFFLLTGIEVALPIIRSYLIAVALNLDVSILYFFAFVPVILLLIRLPISFDGFGIHEGGFIYFLSFVGVSSTLSFSVGLINHIIFLIGLLPGGVFYAFSGMKQIDSAYSSPERVKPNQ